LPVVRVEVLRLVEDDDVPAGLRLEHGDAAVERDVLPVARRSRGPRAPGFAREPHGELAHGADLDARVGLAGALEAAGEALGEAGEEHALAALGPLARGEEGE